MLNRCRTSLDTCRTGPICQCTSLLLMTSRTVVCHCTNLLQTSAWLDLYLGSVMCLCISLLPLIRALHLETVAITVTFQIWCHGNTGQQSIQRQGNWSTFRPELPTEPQRPAASGGLVPRQHRPSVPDQTDSRPHGRPRQHHRGPGQEVGGKQANS